MYCGKCGFNDNGEGNFCKNCGASLRTPAVKKKELSVAFKRAWFAPVAVVVAFLSVYFIGTGLIDFFNDSREGFMLLFGGDVDTREPIINGTYSNIVGIIINTLIVVVPILICFVSYLIAFIGIDKKVKKKCSLSFSIPYITFFISYYVFYAAMERVAAIFRLTGDIAKWEYQELGNILLVIATIMAVIISYLLTWNYLRRFENELKK